jgi:ElaB/YqjD/DUF883 family membrane-anchored ribosome-binding protein
MEREIDETLDAIKEPTAPGYDRLRGRMSEANDRLQDLSETARDKASDVMDGAMDWVRDNPGAAVGAALLVGAGIGALITYLSTD